MFFSAKFQRRLGDLMAKTKAESTTLSVAERVRALYAKDESMQRILNNSSGAAKVYA